MSNYVTKYYLKCATGFFDASDFDTKGDLASLKSDVDKLDIGKFKTTYVDLSKLSNVVKNDFVKRIVYDELVQKVNAIQTIDISGLVINADCIPKIEEIEKAIPNHDKYITIPEFNKFTKENFGERLKQANLSSKNDIAGFVKKTHFDEKLTNINRKVASNKARHIDIEKKPGDHITFTNK